MELIPSFIVFIIAVIWKSEQETKRHFAERDKTATREGCSAGRREGTAKP